MIGETVVPPPGSPNDRGNCGAAAEIAE